MSDWLKQARRAMFHTDGKIDTSWADIAIEKALAGLEAPVKDAQDGGAGSGNFGHKGRPGERGGSGEGSGNSAAQTQTFKAIASSVDPAIIHSSNSAAQLMANMQPQQRKQFLTGENDIRRFYDYVKSNPVEPKPQENAKHSEAQAIKNTLIPSNSYINTPEWKNAVKAFQESNKTHDALFQKYLQAKEQINKECPVLPQSQWDDDTRQAAAYFDKREFIEYGFAPRKNPELYAQLTQKNSDLFHEVQDAQEQRSKAREEMDHMKSNAHFQQILSWNPPDDVQKYDGQPMEGFTTQTTGVPYYDDLMKQGKAQIVTMSPKSYLQYCAYRIFDDATIESTVGAVQNANADAYSSMMESGTAFNMPYLNFRNRQQQGRHRSIAALLNGIDRIPVLIVR